MQHHVEFALLADGYTVRSGINYHGSKVQELRIVNNVLNGWNPRGDALGTGRNAKMLLSGYTIVDREVGDTEPLMSDSKFAGKDVPLGKYVRVEYKVRGWLGKTKNLDGKQLEKDLDLLKDDKADLLVVCLSETAHRKWRGEGAPHQVTRRTGCDRFKQVLRDFDAVKSAGTVDAPIVFEGQDWSVRSTFVSGLSSSSMPEAGHIITTCRKKPPSAN